MDDPSTFFTPLRMSRPWAPGAGGGSGVAPSIVNGAPEFVWVNSDARTSSVPAAGPTAYSLAVDDVVVACMAIRNNDNTDVWTASTCVLFDGTCAIAGGFTRQVDIVHHTGAATEGVAMWTGVVTTSGTYQIKMDSVFAGGTTYRANGTVVVLRGANTGASLVSGFASAEYTATAAVSTGVVVTGGAGFLIACVDTETAQAAITEDPAWTLIAENTTSSAIYRLTSTNITDDGSWTLNAADEGACALLGIKALIL